MPDGIRSRGPLPVRPPHRVELRRGSVAVQPRVAVSMEGLPTPTLASPGPWCYFGVTMPTTSVKLPPALKSRVAALAKKTGRNRIVTEDQLDRKLATA